MRFAVDYAAQVAFEITPTHPRGRKVFDRKTETFGTVAEAVKRVNALCLDGVQGGYIPAAFDRLESHPDFVRFMRFEVNRIGLGDLDAVSFSQPGTVCLSRVKN